MARTVGYRHHGPRKDHQSSCHYCGDTFLRSELYGPDENGYLACADDRPGRVEKQLDYIRALNASQPTEVRGARDRPGPAPDFTQLVAWGWVQTGSGLYYGGGLQVARTDRGLDSLYTVTGSHFDTLEVHAYDYGDPSSNISREYIASSWDGNLVTGTGADPNVSVATGFTTGRLIGANYKFSDFDDAPDGTDSGPGGILVFAYAYGGGGGVLTEVASAWVNGATGEAYSSSGDITTERTSTGLYTVTLTSGTHTVATVSRYTQANPETLLRGNVWGGWISPTVTKVRSVTATAGSPLDSDFLVRLFK